MLRSHGRGVQPHEPALNDRQIPKPGDTVGIDWRVAHATEVAEADRIDSAMEDRVAQDTPSLVI